MRGSVAYVLWTMFECPLLLTTLPLYLMCSNDKDVQICSCCVLYDKISLAVIICWLLCLTSVYWCTMLNFPTLRPTNQKSCDSEIVFAVLTIFFSSVFEDKTEWIVRTNKRTYFSLGHRGKYLIFFFWPNCCFS